jgi:linoleate 10R-lipoxygenase
MAVGMDEKAFPNPTEIDITRDPNLYVHHGYGPHKCIGRPIVEIAMAAQLKVFAKLKNLTRAPGPQGEMKSTFPTPSPGKIEVFMKEDWSDWWPFPTCKFASELVICFMVKTALITPC